MPRPPPPRSVLKLPDPSVQIYPTSAVSCFIVAVLLSDFESFALSNFTCTVLRL